MVETRSHFPRWRGRDGRSAEAPVLVSDEEETPRSGRQRCSPPMAQAPSSHGRGNAVRLSRSQIFMEALPSMPIGTPSDAALLLVVGHGDSSGLSQGKKQSVSGAPGVVVIGEEGETGAGLVELGKKVIQTRRRSSRDSVRIAQVKACLHRMDEGEGGSVEKTRGRSSSCGRRARGCKEFGLGRLSYQQSEQALRHRAFLAEAWAAARC